MKGGIPQWYCTFSEEGCGWRRSEGEPLYVSIIFRSSAPFEIVRGILASKNEASLPLPSAYARARSIQTYHKLDPVQSGPERLRQDHAVVIRRAVRLAIAKNERAARQIAE
jgi:hypothetical protein